MSAAMPGDTKLGLQLLFKRLKSLVIASSSTLHLCVGGTIAGGEDFSVIARMIHGGKYAM